MVKVKMGDVLPANEMKSGTGQRGAWAMIPVKAEKGYDKITIWATNPDDIKGAKAVKVLSIEEASLSKSKKVGADGTEKWYDNCNLQCKLSREEGRFSGGGDFVPVEDDLDNIFNL